MCIIGGIALLAYLQSYQIAKAMKASGMMPPMMHMANSPPRTSQKSLS